MTVSRKHAVWALVLLVILVCIVLAIVTVVQNKRYAVREGTVSGVMRISSAGVWFKGGTSHAIYLVGDDGNKYRLARATNANAYREIMDAEKGDRLQVTGRYWRPRKHGTKIFGHGKVYEGPEMTDDPLDFIAGADFILVADTVTKE